MTTTGKPIIAGAVELLWFEYLTAVQCGLQRFAFGEARSMNHAATEDRDWLTRLADEVTGASGELAFAKWRNRYWDASVNTFHASPDVGLFEIRTTVRSDGCLIIRDNDDSERWYVLVTGRPPSMIIRGWIKGSAAKRDQFLTNPRDLRPAWFVPQHALSFKEVAR